MSRCELEFIDRARVDEVHGDAQGNAQRNRGYGESAATGLLPQRTGDQRSPEEEIH
ncbi:hypothetical protein D3C83_246590 [compost metagenome]